MNTRVLMKTIVVLAAILIACSPAYCEEAPPAPNATSAAPATPAPSAQPAAPAAGASVITDIAITGNQNINAETIRGAITLKPGDEFSDEAAEKDKAAIMSLGYFSAVTLRQENVPGGVKLTYEVTENPKVTDIKIEGCGPVPAAAILAVMKTKPGQVLNTSTLDQDIMAIQTYYGEQRYLSFITADVGVDPATGVLTIPIIVATVESIEIQDNRKTRPYVFLREMKTKVGEYLNYSTLEQDRLRIYGLDILEDIQEPQISRGSDIGKVKVIWKVTEKKTGQVNVGLGYNSTQRLVGRFSLSESNFRGKGQGLNALWEQGTTDAVGGRSSYELGFTEPWLDANHTSLAATGYNKIVYRFSSGIFNSGTFANDQTYNERHKGGELTVSRPFGDYNRVYVGGRFENVETNPALLSSATPDFAQIAQTGDVGSGSLRWVSNTRDLEQDPASGSYRVLSFEVGTVNAQQYNPVSVGDTTTYQAVDFGGAFTKAAVDYRIYMSHGGRRTAPDQKRTVLALRCRIGYSAGTLPFFEQYFIGGADSLRGYREDRFWGTKSLLASAELRKPIAQGISGVVFVDYGDAWDAPSRYFIGTLPQSANFVGYFGVGVGMRVSTPIGHIRLDYGVGTEGGRTHFSMGQAF
jgi:outer membrane protein insertion porin family